MGDVPGGREVHRRTRVHPNGLVQRKYHFKIVFQRRLEE
jgi:hypothetical protein